MLCGKKLSKWSWENRENMSITIVGKVMSDEASIDHGLPRINAMTLFTRNSTIELCKTPLPNTYLNSSDVQAIKPVRSKLLLIPKNLAQDNQVVAFDGDGKIVCILTTNTFSEQLKIDL
jgi:hypothetical protein